MAPFRAPIDQFHEHTAPADWFEGLIKAYVGDGLANDFYREIAAYLDADTRDLIVASLEDSGHSAFVVDRVRAAIAADPRLGGRLALWGRRLMGEALTQAQRVAADRDALTALLAGGVDRPGLDLAALGPDVRPAHRAARRADGRARPRLLSQARRRPVRVAASITRTAATTTCQPWRHQSTPRVCGSKNSR